MSHGLSIAGVVGSCCVFISVFGSPNDPAQAGRASDIRLPTETLTRPCLEPDGWMLTCSSARCLRIVLQCLLTFEASRDQQLDLLTAELAPPAIRNRLHRAVQHTDLSDWLARAVEVVTTRHGAAVKKDAYPGIIRLAQALNVNTAALTFRYIQPMNQCIAEHVPVIAGASNEADVLWTVFYQQEEGVSKAVGVVGKRTTVLASIPQESHPRDLHAVLVHALEVMNPGRPEADHYCEEACRYYQSPSHVAGFHMRRIQRPGSGAPGR